MILSCSGTIGTCCSDGGLVVLIDMTRSVLNIIQIVVPILLTVWAAWGFLQMTINPDTKNGLKKIFNKFVAAMIVFLIPAFVNFTLGLIPETFSVNACWKQAKNKAELARQESKYINPYKDQKTTPIYSNPDNYDPSEKKPETDSSSSGASTWTGGTVTGEEIVAYGKKFLHKGYKLGCGWNGEPPGEPTSCIGFVVGVYKHFGFKLDCTNDPYKYINNKKKYTVVTDAPHRPGDIVLYKGHYAMLTGNGDQIIHSTSGSNGVTYGKSYNKSSKNFIGIVRVNGVQ